MTVRFVSVIAVLTVVSAVLAAPSAKAQRYASLDPLVHASTEHHRVPFERGLFWQVEKPGQAPSFVYGILESNDPSLFDLPSDAANAFESADRVILEVDDRNRDQNEVLSLAFLPMGITLEEMVGPDLFERASIIAGERGVSKRALNQYRPWFASFILSMPIEQYVRMRYGGESITQWLATRARVHGQEVVGVLTPRDVIDPILSLPLKVQADVLRSALVAPEETRDQWYERKRLYALEATAALYDVALAKLAELDPSSARHYEREVERSASRLTDELGPILAEGNAMAFVGATRLPGENGVLKLLADKGYTVRPAR